ncbi:Protein of unknown function, partial [Cotesia congregata]
MAKTRKEGLYSPTKLKKALESVKNGRTIRQTAKDFEIPYSTIRSKMKGINPIEMKKGPSPVLSAEEETNLVNWIVNLGVAEYPRTKESILDSVQLICTKLKKVTPFTNNRPSKSWYNGFMKRHHDVLSTRINNKNLTKRRVNVNEKSIRLWFEEVGSYLKSKNLLNIDPSRVFNLDENCFYLKPKTEQVIVKKSQKNVYNLCNDKDSLTALVLSKALSQLDLPKILGKGFEVCGLYPFCADAIDYSKIVGDNSQKSNLETNDIKTNDQVDNSFINFVEQNINSESLERFKNAAKIGDWDGPLEEKRLYEFWLKTCFISDGYSQLINYN